MIDLYNLIINQYKNYFSKTTLNLIKYKKVSLLDSTELAIGIYRIQRKLYVNGGGNLKELQVLSLVQKQYCGCEIYYSSKIGKNFLLVHGLGTVIGSNVVIGDNCTIYHNVTIGIKYDTDKNKPTIGDNVIIYAGAKIVGNVKIGNNVVIGANAVVTKHIPNNEVWAGIPAKKININNSNKYKLPVGIK